MKPLPRTLTILGVRWKIRRVAQHVLGKGLEGDTHNSSKTIQIARRLPTGYAWAVLLHEVMHAILQQTQGKDLGEAEEQFIEALDEPLMQVLRDNFGVGE